MMHEYDQKGHVDLLVAFASKFKSQRDVELVVVGDGPHKQYLQDLVYKLQISDQVIFKGMIRNENIIEEFQDSNIFVLSSHYETFGVVVIEALACGKPVIATKCGGPECILTKDNGLLVDPFKPELLGEAMLNIKNKINDYNSTLIKDDCYKRFSSTVVAKKLIQIYRKILAETTGVS
jgi:glycosyltransferase involved in cell wall biosynthesis